MDHQQSQIEPTKLASPEPRSIDIIACVDRNNGIGRNGTIPWHIKADMAYFEFMTRGTTVIMGRRTWESLQRKPLIGRKNIVITTTLKGLSGALVYKNLQSAIDASYGELIFVIGGHQLYAEAIPLATNIYLTRVDINANCDVTFPFDLLSDHQSNIGEWLIDGDNHYRFEHYRRS